MFQSKLSVFCKFCIYSKLATALLQNSLGSIRFPHSPSKYPKFLYHGLFILDFLNVGCCYTLMPGIPCKYLSRADLITFSLFAPFFKPSDVRSNLLSTLYQMSRPQWSNFLINVSLCLFFILWFLKIILKCHVIKLLITILSPSIYIARNLHGLKASNGQMFNSMGLILLKRMGFLTLLSTKYIIFKVEIFQFTWNVNRQFIKSQVLSLSELKSLTKLNNKIYINSKGYKSSEIAFQGGT